MIEKVPHIINVNHNGWASDLRRIALKALTLHMVLRSSSLGMTILFFFLKILGCFLLYAKGMASEENSYKIALIS